MKVNKFFLSQIIKEEIKRVLYEEEGIEGHMNALKRIRQMKDVAFGDSNDAVISNLTDLDRKSTRLNSSHRT